MRTMHDALNPLNIPTDAAMVASYIDGLGAPPAGWEARFPHAVVVKIARLSTTNDGHVIDVERGDATPTSCVDWVLLRRAHGADPTVYCTESTWPAVRAAFNNRGIGEPHYWIAAWNEQADLIPGAVAHQYANDVVLRAGYDLSVVADHWPGVDTSQPPAPTPVPPQKDDLAMYTHIIHSDPALGGTGGYTLVVGDHVAHLSNGQVVENYRAAGVAVVSLDDADFRAVASALGAPNGGE